MRSSQTWIHFDVVSTLKRQFSSPPPLTEAKISKNLNDEFGKNVVKIDQIIAALT
jgi:hypothetical protein